MRTLVRYTPTLTRFDRLMAPTVHPASARFMPTLPAVNVREDEQAFHLEVAAPGFKKEDFNIELVQNRLTVSAKQENKTAETAEKYTRREFGFNTFSRSFRLPKNVDAGQISATYTDGILNIDLPKIEVKEPQPKQIAVV